MESNYAPGKENIDNLDEDLHIIAGLVDGGVDEDGNIEWIGTRQQWDKYEQLTEEYE